MTCGNTPVDGPENGGMFGTIEGQTETAPAVAGNDCDRGPRHDNALGGVVTENQSTQEPPTPLLLDGCPACGMRDNAPHYTYRGRLGCHVGSYHCECCGHVWETSWVEGVA